MQTFTHYFQDYIKRLYQAANATSSEVVIDDGDEQSTGGAEKIKIVIDWGALDVDKPEQPIQKVTITRLSWKLSGCCSTPLRTP